MANESLEQFHGEGAIEQDPWDYWDFKYAETGTGVGSTRGKERDRNHEKELVWRVGGGGNSEMGVRVQSPLVQLKNPTGQL